MHEIVVKKVMEEMVMVMVMEKKLEVVETYMVMGRAIMMMMVMILSVNEKLITNNSRIKMIMMTRTVLSMITTLTLSCLSELSSLTFSSSSTHAVFSRHRA